jgi:hypothetical protein
MNKPIRNWDERYDGEDYLFGTQPNDFLASVANKIPEGAKVLCLADGEGRNGVYLASLGHQVTSVDLSSVGLHKAQRLAVNQGVTIETIQTDIAEYDIGNDRWDCIVSIFFHIPPTLRDLIYPRIIEGLKKNGALILESYTPKQLEFGTGGPPIADYMLYPADLDLAFADLDIEFLAACERQVIEGTGHTGQASVVQLLARKSV